MREFDGFWIALGSAGVLLLVMLLSAWQTYRECRGYGIERAQCFAIVTHTEGGRR